jgi:uncharacterized protein YkwD
VALHPRKQDWRGLNFLVLFGVVIALASGCGGAGPANRAVHGVEVPSYANVYSTQAGSNGVRGGGAATDAEHQLLAKLQARGDEAEPDAALAATAAWALRRAYQKQNVDDSNLLSTAAYRFGFAGMVQGFFVTSLALEGERQLMAKMLAAVPSNIRVNRYGIVAGEGSDIAVLVGSVELSLADFPRSLTPGEKLRIVGEVKQPFQRASIFWTNPAGKVREIPGKSRSVDATLSLPNPGIYSLEILGYGQTGPTVLLNVPLFVGVTESDTEADASDGGGELNAEQAEATLLTLLNAERKKQGSAPVEPDAELREVALAHSLDMAAHGFVGHVSPTTGNFEDRMRRANVRVAASGECISLAGSAVEAHRGLLASAAHRVIMLDPSYNHVGIGVSIGKDDTGRSTLHVTMAFGRRVPLEEIRQTPETIIQAIQSYRKTRKLPPLRVDAALMEVAGAGSRALQTGSAKTPEQALALSGAALQRVVNRSKSSRVVCLTFSEILEREQLSTFELLSQSGLAAIGVGIVELRDAKGPRLGVMIAGQAAPEKTLSCE